MNTNNDNKDNGMQEFFKFIGVTLEDLKNRIDALEKTIVFKEVKRGYIG